MEMPLEEGYIYGREPKKPSPVPDIQAMFEAVGVPTCKLGELPHPKDWYAGAKERQRLRDIEMEELFGRKDELRRGWVDLVMDGLGSWGERVDVIRNSGGPTLGLAELLARAAHERPFDEERIDLLYAKSEQANLDQSRLRAELTNVREHITQNEDQISKKEVEDEATEEQRIEEKRLEAIKKAKVEKELARQAALLRGEEWPEDAELEDQVADPEPEEGKGAAAAAAGGGGGEPTSPLGPTSARNKASFLAEPSTSPSPELRGGLARQLPPLPSPPGSAGSTGTGAGGGLGLAGGVSPGGPRLGRSP
mmetsp:Transcript_57228/g.185344  ORF Transcript_57228/g.185344 Transcript_57228/m.185344 type:complete len:308 (+) Transcript_57228:74-997(+)